MTDALPVLLSIPHGGTAVPPALRDRVACSTRDIFDDVDPCTLDIYDLGPSVRRVVTTSVARTVVDVNRAPDDRPPANPDGVVKTATCLGVPVYEPGRALDDGETASLLAAHHEPYHRALETAAGDPGVRLALDCHSMRAVAPAIAPDAGPRPAFCLGNRRGATAPDPLLRDLRACVAAAFDCPPSEVRLNDPFAGGYIVARHGTGCLPWVQVEMNRSWYLSPPWFDEETLHVDEARLAWLRGRFADALARFAPTVAERPAR